MDTYTPPTFNFMQSIMEQFNPALENLVYLGNNYLRAFHGESQPGPLRVLPEPPASRAPH